MQIRPRPPQEQIAVWPARLQLQVPACHTDASKSQQGLVAGKLCCKDRTKKSKDGEAPTELLLRNSKSAASGVELDVQACWFLQKSLWFPWFARQAGELSPHSTSDSELEAVGSQRGPRDHATFWVATKRVVEFCCYSKAHRATQAGRCGGRTRRGAGHEEADSCKRCPGRKTVQMLLPGQASPASRRSQEGQNRLARVYLPAAPEQPVCKAIRLLTSV